MYATRSSLEVGWNENVINKNSISAEQHTLYIGLIVQTSSFVMLSSKCQEWHLITGEPC